MTEVVEAFLIKIFPKLKTWHIKSTNRVLDNTEFLQQTCIASAEKQIIGKQRQLRIAYAELAEIQAIKVLLNANYLYGLTDNMLEKAHNMGIHLTKDNNPIPYYTENKKLTFPTQKLLDEEPYAEDIPEVLDYL